MATEEGGEAVKAMAAATTATDASDEKELEESGVVPWKSDLKIEWLHEAELSLGVPRDKLSPPWQMFLLGNGSPTLHLALLSGSKTKVKVLEMLNLESDDQAAPREIENIQSPHLRRRVLLQNENDETLGYANSWWWQTDVESHMEESSKPIWVNLASKRTEIYREILAVYQVSSPSIEKHFGRDGPFWARHYLFWHDGRPLTLIQEVFSPALEAYLGPAKPST